MAKSKDEEDFEDVLRRPIPENASAELLHKTWIEMIAYTEFLWDAQIPSLSEDVEQISEKLREIARAQVALMLPPA
jgi:hypothetical protein